MMKRSLLIVLLAIFAIVVAQECGEHTSCLDCALDGCHWCVGGNSHCASDESGQCDDLVDASHYWVDQQEATQCPGVNGCVQEYCDDCLTFQQVCAWCEDTLSCHPKGSSNSSLPGCTITLTTSCTIPCTQRTSCGQCVASDSACTWCPEEGEEGACRSNDDLGTCEGPLTKFEECPEVDTGDGTKLGISLLTVGMFLLSAF